MCFRKLFNLDKVESLQAELASLKEAYNTECTLGEAEINAKDNKIAELTAQVSGLNQEIVSLKDTDTELEKFCKDLYVQREIVYKFKRSYKGTDVPENLRNFITPNSYLVTKERLKIEKNANKTIWYMNIGRHIAKLYTWTSDETTSGESDYYLYACETLATHKGDCEDHSFIVSSLEPEIGFAFGFRNISDTPNSDWFGHAFNVFVTDNELYVLDTVGNDVEIYKYSDVKNLQFKINYIITKNYSFVVDGSVLFGVSP